MNEYDLISIVLSLRPLAVSAGDERPVPAWWGRAAHAFFLRLAAASDPAMAGQLHAENAPRPFTVSNLLGHFVNQRPDPAQAYTLRLTALTAPLCRLLWQQLQPGGSLAPGSQIELDYLPFTLEAAMIDPAQHPWAAAATYQALFNAYLLPSNPPPRQVTLQLASPTGFHSAGRQVPLPLPELVFGSLLERWNSFAPLAFPDELRRYAAECLGVTRFDLSSRAVPLKDGGLRFGASGDVTYTTLNYDRYWMSLVSALASFAQFSGVGVGTAMGLGQCRRVAMDRPA
jgi:CRISPR-associated endoribonuclease Cas6